MNPTFFKIEKILIPLDFSETSMLALEHAGSMAQSFNAELVLLHVIEKHWAKFNIISPEITIEEPSGIVNIVEKRMQEIAADINSKYGVKSSYISTNGNIFNEIDSISKEQNIDLIVMGTHGASGSNASRVITISDRPVLSVQEHSKKLGFKNILLPIDDSAHSRQKVHHAFVLAEKFGATINIVGLIDSAGDAERHAIESKVVQVEEFMKKSGIPCTTHMLNEHNQAKATLIYADGINADLIIIMGDQEENLTGRFMGAYSQQIVNHSKIPTLCIQPVYGHLEATNPTAGGF